jgi:hypothetical protein
MSLKYLGKQNRWLMMLLDHVKAIVIIISGIPNPAAVGKLFIEQI